MSSRLIALTLDIAGQAASQQVPGASNLTSGDAGFGRLIGGVLSFMMMIAVILVLGTMVSGSMDWINSGGEKGKVEAARTKITTSITGLIVLAATTAILTLLQSFIGLCFLNFGGRC